MQLIHLSLAVLVGLAVGWKVGLHASPAPDRTAAIAAIDAAMTSIVAQPNQCNDGFGGRPVTRYVGAPALMPVSESASARTFGAIPVLKELRAGLKEEKLDRAGLKARLHELRKANVAPATRSIINALAMATVGAG